MDITPQQKTGILVGVLLIIGGAAFVYFDPLDLDLLGLNEAPPVVQPATPSRAPAPKAPVAAPKAAATPMQAAVPAVPPPAPATAPVPPPAAMPVAAPPVQTMPETLKPVKTVVKQRSNMPDRPRDQDLRHCLELETDAAIAKCAGE